MSERDRWIYELGQRHPNLAFEVSDAYVERRGKDKAEIAKLKELIDKTAAMGFYTVGCDSGSTHKELCKLYSEILMEDAVEAADNQTTRGGEMNVAELIAKANQRLADQKAEIKHLESLVARSLALHRFTVANINHTTGKAYYYTPAEEELLEALKPSEAVK